MALCAMSYGLDKVGAAVVSCINRQSPIKPALAKKQELPEPKETPHPEDEWDVVRRRPPLDSRQRPQESEQILHVLKVHRGVARIGKDRIVMLGARGNTADQGVGQVRDGP